MGKYYKKRRKLPDPPCFNCRSTDVKQGYCRSCGHLSRYAGMETYKPEKPKPTVAIGGGALWELPVRNEDEEEID